MNRHRSRVSGVFLGIALTCVAACLSFAPAAMADTPANIAPFSGNGARALPGTELARPLRVIVTDSSGNPLPGVTVTFAADPADPHPDQIGSHSAVTGAGGIAQTTVTVSRTVGYHPVDASVTGISTPVVFKTASIPAGYAVGDTLAPISATDENGNTQQLSNYYGNGAYMLVDVSSSWCIPSFFEQAPLNSAIADLHAKGVDINLVTALADGPTPGVASTQANAAAWSQRFSESPVLSEDGSSTGSLGSAIFNLLGVGELSGTPATFLVGPNGKILDAQLGVLTEGELDNYVLRNVAPQGNYFPGPQTDPYINEQSPQVGVALATGEPDDPQLVTVNSTDGIVNVASRESDGSYGYPTSYSVGSGPVAVATGDLDFDGYDDIVTANAGVVDDQHSSPGWNDTISVLTSSGRATSNRTENTYTVGQGPDAVAVGDVNGDGQPDIVTANAGDGSGDTISVLLRNAAGTGFEPVQTYDVGTDPTGVAIGDLNGDGVPDVAVANNADGTISVLYGNGQGGLEPAQTIQIGASASDVKIADMNGDGKPDIVVADPTDSAVWVVDRSADNSGFDAPSGSTLPNIHPTHISLGDVDGNGTEDVVATGNGGDFATDLITQSSDTSGLDSYVAFPTVGESGVAVGDLSGNGKMGVVITQREIGLSLLVYPIGLDTQAPITTDDVPTHWVSSPQTVTLTATDTAQLNGIASGVTAIHYLIGTDPADPSDPANNPLTYNPANPPVLQNGQEIRYSAIDGAGNIEAAVTSPRLMVDTVAPLVSDDVPDHWTTQPVTVQLTATDPPEGTDGHASGIAAVHYLIGTDPADPSDPANHPSTYDPANPPVLENGQMIRYVAIDNAGNASPTESSAPAMVDDAPPETSDDVPTASVSGPVTVTLTSVDENGQPGAVSGVAAVHYLIGADPRDPADPGNHPLTYDPTDKPVLQAGERIAYSAVDNAGNVEREQLSSVVTQAGGSSTPPASTTTTTTTTTTPQTPTVIVTTPAPTSTTPAPAPVPAPALPSLALLRRTLRAETVPFGAPLALSTLKHAGQFTYRGFQLLEAGTAKLAWYASVGGHRVEVASGTLSLTAAGRGALTVRLRQAGQTLTTSHGAVHVTARLSFRGTSGTSVQLRGRFTLTR